MLFPNLSAAMSCLVLTLPLTPVLGVTLNNYQRPQCAGSVRSCTNIGPGSCCGRADNAPTRYFVSGDCAGCTSTDFHFVYRQPGTVKCGLSVAASNEGRCVGGQNLRGHDWCRVCGTKKRDEAGINLLKGREIDERAAAEEEEAANADCVDEDVISKDGVRWFKINYDVPLNETQLIEAWADDDNTTDDDLPECALTRETTATQ